MRMSGYPQFFPVTFPKPVPRISLRPFFCASSTDLFPDQSSRLVVRPEGEFFVSSSRTRASWLFSWSDKENLVGHPLFNDLEGYDSQFSFYCPHCPRIQRHPTPGKVSEISASPLITDALFRYPCCDRKVNCAMALNAQINFFGRYFCLGWATPGGTMFLRFR